MVPKTGIEPVRGLMPRGILSPVRLPVPPLRLSWRRHPDSNWGIKVLQTSALPLGYAADNNKNIYGAGDEIRTRDFHLGKVTLYH
jgi:hypothetical protein